MRINNRKIRATAFMFVGSIVGVLFVASKFAAIGIGHLIGKAHRDSDEIDLITINPIYIL